MTNKIDIIGFIKEVIHNILPFLLGLVVTKNKSKDNANELIKKAKKAIRTNNTKYDD